MRVNVTLVVLCLIWSNILLGQSKVHVSEIEERNVGGERVLFANEEMYEGIVYEN